MPAGRGGCNLGVRSGGDFGGAGGLLINVFFGVILQILGGGILQKLGYLGGSKMGGFGGTEMGVLGVRNGGPKRGVFGIGVRIDFR